MNDKGSLRSRYLAWTRPFIVEHQDSNSLDPTPTSRPPYSAICLFLLCIIGFAIQLPLALRIIPVAALAAAWAIAALVIAIRRPRTCSVLLAILYVGTFAVHLNLIFVHSGARKLAFTGLLHGASAALSTIVFIVVVNMPLRDPTLPQTEISPPFAAPTSQLRSPEDNLTLWQWMTVSWMGPLIKVGILRQLNDEDVWFLSYEFQHRHLHDAFRELHGTVVRRLIRANCIDLGLLTVFAIIELAANYSAPILLQYLLQAMEASRFNKQPAIKFASLILVIRLVAAQSGVFSLWFGRRCYERSRGEMITMLYEKTLNRKIVGTTKDTANEAEDNGNSESDTRVGSDDQDSTEYSESDGLLNGQTKNDTRARQSAATAFAKVKSFASYFRRRTTPDHEEKLPASMGKILNMMRNDVYEVAQRFWEFQTLINKPLGLVLALILVWRLLGWPCLIGIGVVLVAQVVNAFLARILISWEKVRRKATDTKLQQISQYVEAIRHLRWYGWHLSWLDGVMQARQKELNLRIITSLWQIAIRFVNTFSSGMLPVAAFYAYTALAGQELRVDVAFPALQLFSMLQSNLREIPNLITVLLNARVAVGRIEDFMSEPDKAGTNVVSAYSDDRLEVKNASFAWPGLSRNVLKDLTLSFHPGLTMIFGPVGAGKSALLEALLGELDLSEGELIRPNSAVGYCAQTPWLQSMSIRENILFTSPYENSRYKETLDACALLPDLATFKDGDLSNIGENGIGLSGGQRARVALARAVYSRSKFLLLDDPLSALDQQTAEWIVKKCLTGPLLKGRTTILVTHRTDLCKDVAEQLIEISHGFARMIERTTAAFSELALTTTTSHPTSATAEEAEETVSAAVPEKFVEDEHRVHGGVQMAVYWEYIKAGKIKWWALVIISAAASQIMMVGETWFLKEWGEAYNRGKEIIFAINFLQADFQLMKTPITRLFDRFPDPASDVQPWLIAFLLIVVFESVAMLIALSFMVVVTYTAGRQMFREVMERISSATFRFYDVTPVGRLMNRLTSDVGTVDGNISSQFAMVAWQLIAWVTAIVVIASVTPLFLVFSLALTVVFVLIFLRFLPASQSLRRLEMVSLSPLMSNFGALLNGLMTVRAFCAQPQFQSRVISVTDAFQKMDHFYWSLQGWLMYRFDTLSGLSTFLLTILAVFSNLTPGLTAFVLIAAGKFVEATHGLCRQYGQLQLDFVSVERVVEILHLEREPPGHIEPPASWPRYGSPIIFTNLSISYTPISPPALQSVNLTLPGGCTTAIVGRTGSGKSTLALSLLSTIPPTTGSITIDGIDLAHVSKQILRERITFLAQDPVLFPGTLRHNLDPLAQHSDNECESVLSRACSGQNLTLTTVVEAGGRNLSQGQRQLVGLARAILRKSAVVILDEATASVDLDTAWEVQRLLREEMVGSTVVTIAHRAGAVRGAEGVVRLDGGRVVEVSGEVRVEEEV